MKKQKNGLYRLSLASPRTMHHGLCHLGNYWNVCISENRKKLPKATTACWPCYMRCCIGASWACRLPPGWWLCPNTQLKIQTVKLLGWLWARNHCNSLTLKPFLLLYFSLSHVPLLHLSARSSNFHGDRNLDYVMWTHPNKWPPSPTIDSLSSIEFIAWPLLCFLSKSCKQTHLF